MPDTSPLNTSGIIRTASRFINITDDEHTSGSPLVIPANTPTKLTLNAATEYIRGLPGMWNGDTSKLQPKNLDDMYAARLTCTLEKQESGAALIEFWINVPAPAPLKFAFDTRYTSKNAAQTLSLPFLFFTGATFLQYGGEFFMQSDKAYELHDMSLFVGKVGAP